MTWVNIEPAAKFAALAEKRVDAVADYTTGLPFYEKAMGKGNVVMMPWADYGFDMYCMSIMASEKTMKERPKVLRAFLEASYMGWRDVMADPKSALAIFKKRVPEIDLAIIEPNMMLGLELMKTDALRQATASAGWSSKKMCALGRPRQHLHGRAAQGRLRGGVHQRVPDQGGDAASEVTAA